MITLLITFLFLSSTTHDIQVAFFKVHQDEQNIYVDFVFEKEDILQTLKSSNSTFSQETLQAYITDNFSLSIDNKKQSLVFGEMRTKNKHLHLQGIVEISEQQLKLLAIENSCLLNIEGHSNIIEIRLHDEERDFLMNKKRTSIKINY